MESPRDRVDQLGPRLISTKAQKINARAFVLFIIFTIVTVLGHGKSEVRLYFTAPDLPIAIASLKEVISALNGRATLLVDIRDPKQFESAHIVRAVNVPAALLDSKLPQFTNVSNIVIYGQDASIDLDKIKTAIRSSGVIDRCGVFLGGWTEWNELRLPTSTEGNLEDNAIVPSNAAPNAPISQTGPRRVSDFFPRKTQP